MDKYNDEDRKDHKAATGLIKNDSGRILIQRHVNHQMLTLPFCECKNGGLAIDELCIEMREGLGIEVTDAIEIGHYEKVYDFAGQPVNIDTHVFRICNYDGTILNMKPDKCAELVWMTEEELRQISEKVADCVKAIL